MACGSSHSICWTIQDSQTSNVYEPVLFANSKDPLGTHFIGLKDLNNEDSILDSNASKQRSLQHILNGLQIM